MAEQHSPGTCDLSRDEDAKADLSTLKDAFKAAEKEGKATYAERKDEVAAQGAEAKATLAKLTADLKEGLITQAPG